MPEFPPSLFVLAGFLLFLLLLAWLSRQVSIQLQIVVYYLSRSVDAPTVALFLIFLPGVIIHEGAHWIVARLFGLRPGKFRVWPKRQGKHIGLGSVSVRSGGAFVDSLVGLAPLVAGSIFVGLIGNRIFNVVDVTDLLARAQWLASIKTFWFALGKPDGTIWAYLLFAVANAMMPSASDREPVKSLLIYAVVAALIYAVLGLPLNPITSMMAWLTPTLQNVSAALLFTIVLDLIVLVVLYLLRLLIGPK